RNRASGLSPSSARRLGLPGPDQAHPEAQIQLPRTPALLLQRRLPGPRARPANLLPPRLRRILLRRAKADGGERPEDLWGSALRRRRALSREQSERLDMAWPHRGEVA